jgi:hypothetical protein
MAGAMTDDDLRLRIGQERALAAAAACEKARAAHAGLAACFERELARRSTALNDPRILARQPLAVLGGRPVQFGGSTCRTR